MDSAQKGGVFHKLYLLLVHDLVISSTQVMLLLPSSTMALMCWLCQPCTG